MFCLTWGLFSPQIAYSSSSPGNYVVSVSSWPRCRTTGYKGPVMQWYLNRRAAISTHSSLVCFSVSVSSSPCRALQGEAAHQELPSCLALEVSYTLLSPFWFLLLSRIHWTRRDIKTVLCVIQISFSETSSNVALNTEELSCLGFFLQV